MSKIKKLQIIKPIIIKPVKLKVKKVNPDIASYNEKLAKSAPFDSVAWKLLGNKDANILVKSKTKQVINISHCDIRYKDYYLEGRDIDELIIYVRDPYGEGWTWEDELPDNAKKKKFKFDPTTGKPVRRIQHRDFYIKYIHDTFKNRYKFEKVELDKDLIKNFKQKVKDREPIQVTGYDSFNIVYDYDTGEVITDYERDGDLDDIRDIHDLSDYELRLIN